MIKLITIPNRDYPQYAETLNELLDEQPQIDLSLDLALFFADIPEKLEVKARPYAKALIPSEESPYQDHINLVFDIDIDKGTIEKVIELARTEQLNRRTLRSLRGYYQKVYGKPPDSLDSILKAFKSDKALFYYLAGISYNIRYDAPTNALICFSIYHHAFRKQGLMIRFYQALKRIIDFDDLNYLEINNIIENKTTNMFNRLRKKVPNNDYLCQLLARKYVKSPFMKLLYILGHREMQIITSEGYIGEVRGRKSPELSFSIHECGALGYTSHVPPFPIKSS